MNICKVSYKTVRESSKEIYKGFGFKHLSDATQYYVHPDNQSFKGTTTLCQPIGESLILFASLISSIMNDVGFGDYYFSEDRETIYMEINVPQEYRDNGVVAENVYRYCGFLENTTIKIAAYDDYGHWLDSDIEHLQVFYKLMPCFCLLLAKEMETNTEYRTIMESFINDAAVDVFVNLHEDFYQNNKAEDFDLEYTEVSTIDTEAFHSFSSSYQIIKDNIKSDKIDKKITITPFPQDSFNEEQRSFVPALSEEFVLPLNLYSVCNAISAGDMLALLLHGPAGTGKTMSCKLICQAIGLPIMETINCTENLDEFVLGKYIPQDEKIIFKESYVTKAIRYGGGVVFEEINFAKPQYLAFLNSLLDDNGFVRLDNGEVIKRHQNFRFFATMNFGYFGTKELNQALYNRFQGIVEIAALSDEAIARMLTARVPQCQPKVDKILSVYHKLQRKIEGEELDVVISPRNLENWARLAGYEGYIKAAEKTIVPIAKCERALEETIRSIIRLYKWN